MLTIRTDIQTTVKDEYFHLLYLASIDEFKLFLDIANENLTKKKYCHQHMSKFRLFKVLYFSIRSSRYTHRHWP